VLNHKLIFTGIVLLLFAMTLGIMRQGIIGKELISTGDQGKFRFALEFEKNTSIQRNDAVSGEQLKNIFWRSQKSKPCSATWAGRARASAVWE
jgi:HAE1 family hydrophobic/amphiphilic exporter-1